MTDDNEKLQDTEPYNESGRVKKNTYFISISQIVQIGLSFILVPLAARYLGDEAFGRYSFAFILSYFVFLFDDFGIATFLTREVAKRKEQIEKYFFNALFLKLGLIVLSILFIGVYLHLSSFPPEKVMVVIIFGLYGLFYSFNQLNYAVFRAFERMEYEMALLVFEKLIQVGLGTYILIQGYGLVVFSWVFVLCSFLSFLIGFIILKNKFVLHREKLQFKFMGDMFRIAILLGINMFLATMHSRLDTLILASMKGEDVVGWYAAAARLILVLEVIPTVLVTAIFPRISRGLIGQSDSFEDASLIYSIGFKYLFYITIPLVVGTLFVADKIILLLYGVEYQQAINALRILIFSAGFNLFNIFFGGFLYAWNKQKEFIYLQLGSIVLNVVLNILLIPKYNHFGCAIASVVSHGFGFVIGIFLIHLKLKKYVLKMDLIKGLFGALIVALICYYVKAHLFFIVGMSMVIYTIVLYLIGGIRFEEIFIIKKRNL